ncbi:17555_t:CDS:1 [Dentiscutata erythropus]|uniref:17555_t:CDS:1 n=1 Tax=Dentiscutata erythropus TaxID=1348616 RepID=A0A9N9NBE2_9GLOM|nr:17555_t:CDS:1 [Dentiscutata erythropus]
MKTIMWFQNVYFFVTIKDEIDNNQAENINDLIDKVSKEVKSLAGIYVTDTCTSPFFTEVMKDDQKVKLYFTYDLDLVKIFKQCYEEEKSKDLMEFMQSKGLTDLHTNDRRSDDEYRSMGFTQEGSEREKEVMDLLEEFANTDYIKNKYGEDAFEFNVLSKQRQ